MLICLSGVMLINGTSLIDNSPPRGPLLPRTHSGPVFVCRREGTGISEMIAEAGKPAPFKPISNSCWNIWAAHEKDEVQNCSPSGTITPTKAKAIPSLDLFWVSSDNSLPPSPQLKLTPLTFLQQASAEAQTDCATIRTRAGSVRRRVRNQRISVTQNAVNPSPDWRS